MKKILLLIVLFNRALALHAQLDNEAFNDFFPVDTFQQKQQKLSFGIYNLNFLRNNEYFNEHVDGYTLFGSQLLPSLMLKVSPYFRVEAGVFLNKDFGRNQFSQIQPMYRAHYARNGFQFLFGNLKGHVMHNLPEPVFNFERVIQQRQEHGLQFLYNTDKFNIDGWVDWQRATASLSVQKERIWAGTRLNARLVQTQRLSIFADGFLTVLHEGGQIDTSNLGAYSIFNGGAGFSMNYSPENQSVLKRIRLEAWGMQTLNPEREISGFSYKTGFGVYPNLTFDLKWLSVMGSWWYGDSFVSPVGGLLYQSYSSNVKNPGRTEQQRNLLIVRFLKDIPLATGASLTFRVEPVFNLNRPGKMEFSHGLFTNFRYIIPLKKWHEG